MADAYLWRGGSGLFGTADNWDDQTTNTDPALTPPGAADTAEFNSGAGTITGTGTVANLQFLGTEAWTVGAGAVLSATGAFFDEANLTIQDGATITNPGTSAVIDSNDSATTATLSVTGAGSNFAVTGSTTWLYVGTDGNGSLSITNGASADAGYLIALGGALGTSTISVDATSSLEIGTLGGAAAGALTVDAGTSPQLFGYGTIAANVVNNNLISADSSSQDYELEITGSVTGTGTLDLQHGYHTSPTALVYGGVLRLDGAVANTQQVDFGYSSDLTEAPELILADPIAFAGTLDNFQGPGATIDLAGDSVTGASVTGSTLTVTLAAGGPLNFALAGAMPVTSELVATGSEVRILPIRALVWTGASDSAFGNALNWNDTTDAENPSASAPGVDDLAEITNAGSITGNGTAYQLTFDGTNTVTGTLTVLDLLSDNSGTTDVTGALSAASATVSGALSALSGGRISVGGSITLVPGAMLAIDGTSTMEDGTAGGAAAGSLTVDAAGGVIGGDGTIAAPVVNNGLINANDGTIGGNVLEVTGAITGSGMIDLQTGYNPAPGTVVPGGVLLADSTVGSQQHVVFGYVSDPGDATTLALGDPTGFAGVLDGFDLPGDTLELVGDAVTGASVSGSTLTVSLGGGGPLTFNLGYGVPLNSQLYTAGSDVRILPVRTFDWTGASDSNFANALNWDDTTDGANPAATAPGTIDIGVLTNAGSITGTGTTYQLSFYGTNTVVGTLTALDLMSVNTGLLTVTGSLTSSSEFIYTGIAAKSGGRIVSGGSIIMLAGAVISVDGGSSMEVGTADTGTAGALTVDASVAGITGDGTVDAALVNNGTINASNNASGSNTLEVTGAVTGGGGIYINVGYDSGGSIVPGAIVQLDGSVAASQNVTFNQVADPREAPALILNDPTAFNGVLNYFDSAGDTLELTGETVTAVSVTGSVMTATLATGGPLTFDLGFGAPQSNQLLPSGSEIRVVPLRELDWTGASDTSFNNALNWNDITEGLDPASAPPGSADFASLTNAGSVTGDATVYQLGFAGTNTLTGSITAIDQVTETSGSLTVTGDLTAQEAFSQTGGALIVTGSLSLPGGTVDGAVTAVSGGRIVSSGAITLAAGATLGADGSSVLEAGTAGTASPGGITIDPNGAIDGTGTLDGAVVNNGQINVYNAATLEITGAVTGNGTIGVSNGYSIGPGSTIAGGVLRFDSTVASSQQVDLSGAALSAPAPEVILADPAGFAGLLQDFDSPGDTLELVGESVTGASVSGSVMTVTLAAGGPLTFNLGVGAPLTSQLLATGSEVRVVPVRDLVWTGAVDSDFNNASNWNDTTDALNPALTAPGTADVASLTNAGSVTGTDSVYQLSFTGTNTVAGDLTALNTLTETAGSLAVTGSLAVADALLSGTLAANAGGAITTSGSVSLSSGAAIAVDGSSSMEVGTAGGAALGHLTVDAAPGVGIFGDGTLAAAVVNDGQILAATAISGGNSMEVTGAVTGGGEFVLQDGESAGTGAVLRFDGSVGGAQTVAFDPATVATEAATLVLANPVTFAGTLSTFDSVGDTIDLIGEIVTGASIVASTMTVTTTSGGPFTFSLANTPSDTPLTFAGDSVSVGALCFLTGTLIRTPSGETPVERLTTGDLVVTAGGAMRPIVWVGTGRVLATRGRRNAATPVIVRKGALGTNIPHCDLRVTKGHSLFLDGVLIPVECLVNHRSILWDDHAQEVSLYHIELETHDVLLANGAPAESYRDDGNRWLFQNANEGWDMPPRPPCAPILTGGSMVDASWRRLLDRSGPRRLPPLTSDPDLHLLSNGQRIDPASIDGSIHVFSLRDNTGPIRIVSRAAVPADLGTTRDFRTLGVSIRWIALRAGSRSRVIDAADDRLTEGFHDHEPTEGLRWTDGEAVLPASLFDVVNGPFDIILELGHAAWYPEGSRVAA